MSFGSRKLPALVIAACAVLFPTTNAAQSSGISTYCNPIDIDYKYNFEQINEGISYRSGADPVIVNHRGMYYLFVTMSGGYWYSKDLQAQPAGPRSLIRARRSARAP